MKKTVSILTVTASLILACVMGFVLHARREAVKRESALRALVVEVGQAVQAYAKANGAYPTSLDLITVTNYPDGSSPAMLKELVYESDGETLHLDWKHRD